ncbi:sugar phosphate isomerase/epimerase family protein [Massiliimalia massiliensis]|jgi:sugar phosphate isomerase/epimerase|uniref:sugar phosphate isomerase/epimerase family protein n=1 Tax=Massiliimalia massiliensis TaxID=1852384 RepID=UPI000984A2D7|nr:sugar phosphate isomerase/epimerase [Massiliimalia massiliensis]
MKVGLFTNSLAAQGMTDLREIAQWAVEHGFEELEVGASIQLDEKMFDDVVARDDIKIGAMTICRNPFFPGEEGKAQKEEMIRRLKWAMKYNIPKFVTSTGIDRGCEWDEKFDFYDGIRKRPIRSMDMAVDFLSELLDISKESGTKICLETCPAMGNIAISPYLNHELFSRLPDPRLGMAYDPSHFVWEMMDPYMPIFEFKDRIFHVHGKDTEINRYELNRKGILSDYSWWRYRIPGLGEIQWNKLVSNLFEAGYDGVISVEHEDPVWEGTMEKVQKGLLIGQKTLRHAINMQD